MRWVVIYLAPHNYHRYHSPAFFTANYRRHIAGWLTLVRPSYIEKHKDCLKENERVNLLGEWKHGFFAMSFIGALAVGSIKLHFDDVLKTDIPNPLEPYVSDRNYQTLFNQEFEEDTNGNQFLKIPQLKSKIKENITSGQKDPLSGEPVLSSDDMVKYLNEFDIKDLPSNFEYSPT